MGSGGRLLALDALKLQHDPQRRRHLDYGRAPKQQGGSSPASWRQVNLVRYSAGKLVRRPDNRFHYLEVSSVPSSEPVAAAVTLLVLGLP